MAPWAIPWDTETVMRLQREGYKTFAPFREATLACPYKQQMYRIPWLRGWKLAEMGKPPPPIPPIHYQPETEWTREGTLVYTLRPAGVERGDPVMVKDVVISIQADRLHEKTVDNIARTVWVALNRKYWNKDPV